MSDTSPISETPMTTAESADLETVEAEPSTNDLLKQVLSALAANAAAPAAPVNTTPLALASADTPAPPKTWAEGDSVTYTWEDPRGTHHREGVIHSVDAETGNVTVSWLDLSGPFNPDDLTATDS